MAPSSSGLGLRTFAPATRVQIPLGLMRKAQAYRLSFFYAQVWLSKIPAKIHLELFGFGELVVIEPVYRAIMALTNRAKLKQELPR
jgi:hypothetical protein